MSVNIALRVEEHHAAVSYVRSDRVINATRILRRGLLGVWEIASEPRVSETTDWFPLAPSTATVDELREALRLYYTLFIMPKEKS